MKKLKCQKGQGSLMLVLMIAGAVGVIASSLMLNMFNLQRASISLRIRSVTLRAMEEIAQEVKQAYDMAGQVTTTCAADFAPGPLINVGAGPRFCFRDNANALFYYNRFTIRRNAGVPVYTTTQNLERSPSVFEATRMFAGKNLPFLTQAFAFNMAAHPYLPATAPSLFVQMNTNTCAIMSTPCIDCSGGGNADCYKFDVCINGSVTCAAPFIINPIFAFMR